MPIQFSCFNTGTGHNSLEKTNLLMKLFDDCPSLGLIGKSEHNIKLLKIFKNDIKYFNDGPGAYDISTGIPGNNEKDKLGGGQGWGIKDKTRHTLDMIEAHKPSQVNLAGHSRGAVLSIRIAAYLWERSPQIPVNLFLLDPCEFSKLGTKRYNRYIYPNVKNLTIVAAEDVKNWSGHKYDQSSPMGFQLLDVKLSDSKRKELKDPKREVYIRMPGSHGTGGQVDGNPIGEAVFQIARRRFRAWRAPVGKNVWTDQKLAEHYFKIHKVNPLQRITKHQKFKKDKQVLMRKINDNSYGQKGNFSYNKTNSRAQYLNKKGITNQFRDEGEYFINEHHHALFQNSFPKTTHAIMTLRAFPHLRDVFAEEGLPSGVLGELQLMKVHCPEAFSCLSRAGIYVQ